MSALFSSTLSRKTETEFFIHFQNVCPYEELRLNDSGNKKKFELESAISWTLLLETAAVSVLLLQHLNEERKLLLQYH